MSGLARLLARHVEPGVYHWSSAQSEPNVRHAVEHAGWRCVVLDTWAVEDKGGVLPACQQAFGLPESLGHGFDALGDALTDVRPVGDETGVLVLWLGWSPFARTDRVAFDVAVDVFAARVDGDRDGGFAVLLQGPGPTDLEVPELDPH